MISISDKNSTVMPLNANQTFTANNNKDFKDEPRGGILVPALSDLHVRFTNITGTNIEVLGSYNVHLIKAA